MRRFFRWHWNRQDITHRIAARLEGSCKVAFYGNGGEGRATGGTNADKGLVAVPVFLLRETGAISGPEPRVRPSIL
jgi:hypothetical protein